MFMSQKAVHVRRDQPMAPSPLPQYRESEGWRITSTLLSARLLATASAASAKRWDIACRKLQSDPA